MSAGEGVSVETTYAYRKVRPKSRGVGIYARISADPEDSRVGVARQLEDCRALAAREGWEIAHEYVDNDASAWSGRVRPNFERMLIDIKCGRISQVITWHTDRLARRVKELVHYVDVAEAADVLTVTVAGGPVDLSSAAGRMQVHMLGTIAQYESDHRAERIARSHSKRAAEGKFHGGRRCYGYDSDGLTVRPIEAEVIRHIVGAVIAGDSLRAIASNLNRNGHTTAGGNQWTPGAVRELVKSPRIAGIRTHRGVEHPALWPQVVAETDWRTAVAVVTSEQRRTNSGINTVRYLGSGLYVCGVCKSTDVRVSRVDSRRRYRCRNRVKGDPITHVGRDQRLLDEFVENAVLNRLSQSKIADMAAWHTIGVAELIPLRSALIARKDKLSELFAVGTVSESQLTAGTSRMNAELADIDAKLISLSHDSIATAIAGRENTSSLWSNLPLPYQRSILAEVVTVTILPVPPGRSRNGVYFRPEGVQFEWNI